MRLLAALLLLLPSIAAASGMEYGGLYCEILDEKQTKAMNPTARRMHFVYCMNTTTGEMVGALVRRKGGTACTETGRFDFLTSTFCRTGGTCPYPATK